MRDINFMWLLAGEESPSYSTLSQFRKERLKNCLSLLAS
ncbi:MAG: transposase [Clostridium sp.]